MFDTYYIRLSMVHPKLLSRMDTRLGFIIAETATTGKFFIQDVEFESTVDTNATTGATYNMVGEIRIAEPLGTRFLDYLRLAAAKLGIINWLDARFILDIELRAENYDPNEFFYSYPIILKNLQLKNINEKGTEYSIGFIHAGDHSQMDIVQPLAETLTVKNVSTVGEYFKEFSRLIELQEFKYAESRQKFGSKKPGGGEHPAAADQYHDEYYFILDPKLKGFEFKTKEVHDPGKDTSYENKSRQNREQNKKIDISAKKGTTISSQITKILQMANGLEDLQPGKNRPQTKEAQGSSAGNKNNNESMLQEIHQFYRIASHTVYKKYDPVRGRYAVKHFFAIWLADQPNLVHYPEELDLTQEDSQAQKLLGRLDRMIKRGHLRKAYYHWYTGMNTDVIKVNLDLNNFYYLPSFPNYWTEHGETSDGRMEDKEKYNWNKKEAPYTWSKINPPEPVFPDQPQTAPYIEDIPYSEVSKYLLTGYPQFRPRMEGTEIIKQNDSEHTENEFLVQRIFEILTSPYDLMHMKLDIIGDPWWLGEPGVMIAGKIGLDKMQVPDSIKNEIKAKLPGPDPDFNSRDFKWTGYNRSQTWYAGAGQIYYCAQLPSNDTIDDLMLFDYADTVSGIYQVYKVTNIFKDGKWTQQLDCKRNFAIPSKIIPKFVNGQYTTFENYIASVIGSTAGAKAEGNQGANAAGESSAAKINEQRAKELVDANLSSQNTNFGAADRVTQNTMSSDLQVREAYERKKQLEAERPSPAVANPVDRANELVRQGFSKEQAYTQAKKEYSEQLLAKFEHLDTLNMMAFMKVDKYKPYAPETMTAIALEKSNAGGLEDWKKNTEWKGPATLNNPGGLGHDVRTGRYNKYDSFDQGVAAINDYYNYGVGVPAGRRGPDRYLLPRSFTGSSAPTKTGNTELKYIDNISKNKIGGGG